MGFYRGTVLRLDLTRLHASTEPLNAEWARLFVGGKGLLLRYLFDELPPGADALSPENPLILATGPFAGTVAATCSRLVFFAMGIVADVRQRPHEGKAKCHRRTTHRRRADC